MGKEFDAYYKQELEASPITPATPATPAPSSRRWLWTRRCMAVLMGVGVLVYTTTPLPSCSLVKDTEIITTAATTTVLHTGFPPVENIRGQTISSHQVFAIAFSPQPSLAPSSQPSSMASSLWATGEGWWDRIFHRGHVHLNSVQIAVTSPQLSAVKANFKICTTTHTTLWKNLPNDVDCVDEKEVQVTQEDLEEDADTLFGVLEWKPDDVIVLKKRQLYWLVVETHGNAFDWVFAEKGKSPYGSALQTEKGWAMQAKEDPIPTAIVIVEDHA